MHFLLWASSLLSRVSLCVLPSISTARHMLSWHLAASCSSRASSACSWAGHPAQPPAASSPSRAFVLAARKGGARTGRASLSRFLFLPFVVLFSAMPYRLSRFLIENTSSYRAYLL